MRFKDVKKHIRKIEKENRDLISRNSALKSIEERRYPFNLLEIIVRPSRQEHLVQYELAHLDLRVIGNEDMPTFVSRRTLSTFDLLQENEVDFIKGIGELLAAELMAYGKKVKK